MSSPLRIDRGSHGIVTLWLDPNPAKPRGGVVVLDSWLIDAIAESCAAIKREGCTGLVLASASPRVFVAGADLAEIDALDDAALHAYLERGAAAFAAIPALGVPTAAVVHRAALGGGLELAMHCDALIGRQPDADEKPWLVGLPECGLGICPGWGGTQMLPARIDAETALVATANGSPWKCTAAPAGLFDRVLPPGSTVEHMIAEASAWITAAPTCSASTAPRRTLGPADANRVRTAVAAARAIVPTSEHSAACFDCVEIGISKGWTAAVAAERAHLVRLRHTPEARAKLQAFLSK
ncbi:MAG: enoyl-CoA hydratase/isomerase family protein [Phycisphaerae bacterium]|nr:enoyl-CoA hydratase/isomerase family protein [Phycisphaerae bacterium]